MEADKFKGKTVKKEQNLVDAYERIIAGLVKSIGKANDSILHSQKAIEDAKKSIDRIKEKAALDVNSVLRSIQLLEQKIEEDRQEMRDLHLQKEETVKRYREFLDFMGPENKE